MKLCLHSINSNSVYLPSVVNVYINTKKLFFYNITFYWTDSNMAQNNSIENPLSLRAKVCIAASNDLQIFCIIVLLVINALLSIITSLGNTLILYALHKESALHPPSKLLFRCLALTDLLVGCISQPLYILYLASLLTKHQDWRGDLCFYFATFSIITSNILCLVSLLTSTAISIDRLLALNLGLRYRHVVTFKRTLLVLLFLWAVSIGFMSSSYPLLDYTKAEMYAAAALCVGNLGKSSFCYAKIIWKIRQHQRRVQTNGGVNNHGTLCTDSMTLNNERYKKTISSVLWIQLTLTICYLPFIVTIGLVSYKGFTSALVTAWGIAVTLVFFNSSLNPFLYCWKIKEIRVAVKGIVSRLFPF